MTAPSVSKNRQLAGDAQIGAEKASLIIATSAATRDAQQAAKPILGTQTDAPAAAPDPAPAIERSILPYSGRSDLMAISMGDCG